MRWSVGREGVLLLHWLENLPGRRKVGTIGDALATTGIDAEELADAARLLSGNGLVKLSTYRRPLPKAATISITPKGREQLQKETRGRAPAPLAAWRDLAHGWRTNGQAVYFGNTALKGADVKTFQVLNQVWARDARAVFTLNSRLKCDAATFQVLNEIFARDKDTVYYLEGAARFLDAATFRVLDTGRAPPLIYADDEELLGYAADANGVYFHESGCGKPKLVRGANPQTFRSLGRGFGIDGERLYAGTRRLENPSSPEYQTALDLKAKASRGGGKAKKKAIRRK